MATTIAVLSQKGGTGKTTAVRTLADVFTRAGLEVLAVDLDPQGNLSDYFDVPPDADPTIGDVLSFGTGFSDVMKSFLLYLDENQVGDFLQNIDKYCDDPSLLHKSYSDFFGAPKTKAGTEDLSARKTVMAIRKRLRHLIDEGGIHSSSSTLIEDVFEHLRKGKTVILDLSLRDNYEASIISTLLVRELFDHNKRNYTAGSEAGVIPAVLFIEEAQNVLSDEFVKSQANPFVRCAKGPR